MASVVVIGAGPAGIAASATLVEHGVAPIVVDEARRPGGQVWRMPPPDLDLDIDALLGSESGKFRRTHAAFDAIRDRIDYRPETLAWNVFDGEVYTASGAAVRQLRYDALIVATGATDRILPVKGWTLPGVFTLGGAQALLKEEGCLIGRRIVFCGSSPLLYLAALQCRMMGAEIVAILDTTPIARKLAAAPLLAARPRTFARGLSYLARLRRSGVDVRHGVDLVEIVGRDGVEAIRFRGGEVACDAVALGFGLRSETQLAELAGCALRHDPVFHQWQPDSDPDGRCGNGVYVAGDGARIGGADAAALGGRLAAAAALEDLGIATIDRDALRRELAGWHRFQRGLARAFAWPHWRLHELPDDVPVCRCENVTMGELREALAAPFGADEANRLKALTRCGMGRCQGRFCGPSAMALAGGRLRAQAPVKPLPLSATLVE